jgi:O-antigen ligase
MDLFQSNQRFCALMQWGAIFLMVTLPWLNPFAPGPSPATVPLIFCWVCVGGILGLCWGWFNSRTISLGSALAWAWFISGLLSAMIGLCQYFGVAGGFSPWMNQVEMGQAFANLRQRNQFATLTSISLVALIWLAQTTRLARCQLWLSLVAAALLMAGNAASSSRTGLLQLSLLCILFALWRGWRNSAVRGVLLTSVTAYLLASLILPMLTGLELSEHGMIARLRSGEQSCGSRRILWSNVLHLIAQKPWFGWGGGELDYAHFMTLYPGPRFCEILDNAHNLPLHLAVELGIPLALAVCAGAGWIVWRARPWRETDPTRQMAWAVLAVIMLHSMLEYPLWYGPFQMAFGLCVWMLWPAPREPAMGSRPSSRAAPAIRLVVAAALLAAVAYAAWDYHRISQLYLASQARDPAYRDDTLEKVRGSWLFRNQVRFAELTTTALKRDNAQWTFDTATALLHYSPEPRVIEKVIESAVMLGRDDEALLHLVRYRAAFPEDYKKWRRTNGLAGPQVDLEGG